MKPASELHLKTATFQLIWIVVALAGIGSIGFLFKILPTHSKAAETKSPAVVSK